MDRGAWWAVVHGVTEGRTRLSDITFTFHFHALEKEMATHSSVLAWRIPGTGEPGGLPSMGSHRVGHDWRNLAAAAAEVRDLKQLSLSHLSDFEEANVHEFYSLQSMNFANTCSYKWILPYWSLRIRTQPGLHLNFRPWRPRAKTSVNLCLDFSSTETWR